MSKAADGSKDTWVSADRIHKARISDGTEVTDVEASTSPDGSQFGALSFTVSKGSNGLDSKESNKLEVDSTGRGPTVGVGKGEALLQKTSWKDR